MKTRLFGPIELLLLVSMIALAVVCIWLGLTWRAKAADTVEVRLVLMPYHHEARS